VQEFVDRHRRELGVRAATTARVVGDAGADQGGVDALADIVDHAGGLAARDLGELGRVEHGPAALGVGEVHADGVDADADLAGRRRRIGHRRQGEHPGRTEAGDLDRSHVISIGRAGAAHAHRWSCSLTVRSPRSRLSPGSRASRALYCSPRP
jgi:hypothetical protein